MIFSLLKRTVLLCAVFLLCSAVFSQEYVVTASREKEDPLDSAANTTVITADEIEKSGKNTVVELLKDVPGLNFTSYSSDAQAQVSMRGFGENSFGRVLVMVDGKRLNNPDMSGINLLSVPLASIERIEIVDGPASALYGNSAVGGVINIITKEPAEKLSGTAAFSLGSFWTANPQFSISAANEKAGIVASIDYFSTEGWRNRTGSRIANALVSGFVDLTDKLTLKSSLNYTDSFYEMPGGLTEAQFNENPRQAQNYDDDAKEHHAGAALGLEWNLLPDLSLTIPVDYGFKLIKTNTASWGSFSDRFQHRANLMPAVRYGKNFGDFWKLNVSGGVDSAAVWQNEKTYAEKQRETLSNKSEIAQYQAAPYARVQAAFGKYGSIGVSARYDTAWITARSKDGSVNDSNRYGAFAYSADAVYRPVEQFSVYARGGSLFRYPFVDEVASIAGFGTPYFNKDLKPETGYNAELGIKTDFGKLFYASLNAYYMPLKNEIAYDVLSQKNKNYGETLRIGGTFSAKTNPVSFFSAQASCSYVYAAFSAGPDKGKRVPLVPDFSASGSVSFYVPYVTISPDVSFKNAAFQGGDNANEQKKIPAYWLLGFTVTFTPKIPSGDLSFIVRADNLLGIKYAPLVYGYGAYYPAPGRSFSVGARYNF